VEAFLTWIIDPRTLVGICIGVVIMYFVAKNNPEWVQKFYKQQVDNVQGLPAAAQEKLAQAEKIIADAELEKKVTDILAKIQGK
jgi:hypothetical protein